MDINYDYNVLTEEKRKLESELELAKYEFKVSYSSGLDFRSNIKNVDLNKLNPLERVILRESLNNYKVKKFKLAVLNTWIRNIATENMWPVTSENIEFKDYQDLEIDCDTFIRDENGEFTRSVININGYYFDCPPKMYISEYIDIYLNSLKYKVLQEVYGSSFDRIVKKIAIKMFDEDKKRARIRKDQL